MTTPQSVEKMLREFEWQFENRVRTNQSLREEAPWMFSWLRTIFTTNRQQAFEEGVKAERERVVEWVENYNTAHYKDVCTIGYECDVVMMHNDLITHLTTQNEGNQ